MYVSYPWPASEAFGTKITVVPCTPSLCKREVRCRVSAGQVKVDDVVCLCELKPAAGRIGLRKGRRRRVRSLADVVTIGDLAGRYVYNG